jgi:serine-type D-Ala-D-Ala carboxypeptidase/endopeptidase
MDPQERFTLRDEKERKSMRSLIRNRWLSLVLMWGTGCALAGKQDEKNGLKSTNELATKIDHILNQAYENRRFAGLSIIVRRADQEILRNHYGYQDIANRIKPDDFTVYEIGSISKVFTRLLLALDTEISLQDSIRSYLPKTVTVPAPGGQELRIQDLALHTGFRFSVPCVPRPPKFESFECFGFNADDEKILDPYHDVTEEKLTQYVDAYGKMLLVAPGEEFPIPGNYYEYSNAGMALLGNILAKKHDESYEGLLKSRILKPLEMNHTYVAMPCEDEESGACRDLAKVYRSNADGSSWEQSSLWHMNGMAGAGAIRSSLADMGQFLAAEMSPSCDIPEDLRQGIRHSKTRLAEAENQIARNLCGPLNPNQTTCNSHAEPMYLGWPADSGRITFFHGGQTGSSQSMIMISQDEELGLVILTNSIPKSQNAEVAPHIPNNLALCIFQLAGKPLGPGDACKALDL